MTNEEKINLIGKKILLLSNNLDKYKSELNQLQQQLNLLQQQGNYSKKSPIIPVPQNPEETITKIIPVLNVPEPKVEINEIKTDVPIIKIGSLVRNS